MSKATDLTSWCFRERERLHAQLDELRSGSLRVSKRLKSGWIDVTPGNIQRIEHSIEALDHMLVCYGRGFYENAHNPLETM